MVKAKTIDKTFLNNQHYPPKEAPFTVYLSQLLQNFQGYLSPLQSDYKETI